MLHVSSSPGLRSPPKPIKCHKAESLFSGVPLCSTSRSSWVSWFLHTMARQILLSQSHTSILALGFFVCVKLVRYGGVGFRDQNEKGNLRCHIVLGPAVMPDIKLQSWSWIGIPFWMSLLIHVWVLYDETSESCQGSCAVYGGAGWEFSWLPAACNWLLGFV